MPQTRGQHLLRCAWSWKIATPHQTGRWGQRRRGTSVRRGSSQGCPLLLLPPPSLPPSSPHLHTLSFCPTKCLFGPGWAGSGNRAAGWTGGGRKWRRRSPWHCQHSPLDLTRGGRQEKRRRRREKKQEAEQKRAESCVGL